MKQVFKILFLITMACSFACSSGKDKQIENVVKTRTVLGYQLDVSLVTPKGSEQKKSDTAQFADFRLRMTMLDKQSNIRKDLESQYEKSLIKRYFAFEIEHDIYIEQGGEKINPQFTHYEQGTDLSSSYQFLISFDQKIEGDIVFVIDPKYPSIGKQKIKFNKEELFNKDQLL